jgi:TolB-like protein/Tfp pilus assembly protein PilF
VRCYNYFGLVNAASNLPDNHQSPAAKEVLSHLAAVTGSPGFTAAPRKAQFLRYLVERALAGHSVTEYAAGVDVFGRPPTFNPSEDSIVRTEATRLRQKLREYYATHVPADGIRIELPLRSYTPVFVTSSAPIEPVPVSEGAGQPAHAIAIDRDLAGTGKAPEIRQPGRSRIAWATLALIPVIAVIGLVGWRSFHSHRDTASVAILPFLNLTGDAGQEYFSDSITDELTEALAETTGLRVIARTSAFQFKGKMQDVREIGRRLNVAALVEGSVRRNEGKLQLVVHLISTQTALHMWSKTFEVADHELPQAEGEIARSTQRALLGKMTDSPLLPKGTADPHAHDFYLRAVYFFYKADPDSLRKTLELARRAVKLDPSFVRAHWLIVKAEQNLAALGEESPVEASRNSESNLKAVLALDASSTEAHSRIAFQTYVRRWDWPAAESEFRTALAAGGPAANALNFYGWSLMTRGRFSEAHALFDLALEIDPLVQTGARSNSAIAWLMQRKYANAKRAVDSMLELNPNSVNAQAMLSWIALAEGDCTLGRRIEHKLIELAPANGPLVEAVWSARCGSSDDGRQALARVLQPGANPHLGSYPAAEAYSMLGDGDLAIQYLNQTADEKSDMILYLAIDPLLDRIREDPRVQNLARRIGLSEIPIP